MPSPFDMITHSPIMQLANLARAGQNPMGLIQQLSGQNAPIMQGLNLIQGKNEAQLRTMAQNLAKQRGITCDKNDFWATMNMMYSDYGKVAKMYSVDNTNFYADMAAAFLQDKDAVDGKLVEYWERIVERG